MTSQFDPFAPSPPPLLSTLPHTKSLPTNVTFQSTKSLTDDAKYDDDMFGLKSSGVGLKDERKSQPRIGAFGSDSTSLPTFGDFAHATYRTPFDSPDPIEEVVDQTQHIAVNPRVSQSALTSINELDHQPGSSLSATTTITTIASSQPTSLFSMEAYDPLSIFHTVPQSTPKDLAKPELRKSQTTPVEGRKRSKSTTSASSSNSSTNTKPSTFNLPFDPVEEAVIPEILTSKELLARRASEPTLGSRRAALAAAAAREEQSKQLPLRKEIKPSSSSAKGSAHSSPRLASSRPAPLLHVDVTDRLSIPAASDVNLAGPFRDVSQGPVTPRQVCDSCNRMAFASSRCATHLLQQLRGDDTGEPTTPTTIIRRAHNLWRRSVEPSAFLSLKWEFWKKAERYVVQLWEDQLTGQRTVLVNGKVSYRGKPQESPWRLHIVLGRSKSSAFESIIGSINRGAVGSGEMIAGFNYDVGHEFELWIEGFPFTEARNNWLSELGVQHAIQAEDDEARSAAIHERHFKDLQYITKHWIRQDSVWKTAYGYKKNLIEWRFTLNGRKHLFSLTHSEVSGKRKLILDNRPILVKKPNLISGLIRKKSTSHVFECDGVEMEVMIHKVGGPLNSIHSALWSDGQQHPFVYELFIDRVSFSRCTKTLSDVAGGDFLIDDKLGQQKKEEMKRKKREAELRRDPRSIPSPDPET